jgi:apolipoprotein N-acyltransferase
VNERKRYALLTAYAGVTFLAFPQPVGDSVVDLGVALGWLAPALLLGGIHGLPVRRAAALGFAFGTLAQTAVLHWLYIVSVRYGHAPPALGLLGPLGMGAHTGVFVSLFCASFAWFEGRVAARNLRIPDWVGPGAAAVLWTAAEWLRAAGQIGFPWSTLGYSQSANTLLLGLASVTGVYGLSFTVALGGAAIARAALDRSAASAAFRAAVAGVVLLHAAGWLSARLQPVPGPDAPVVRVAVLQGNIEQGVKWDPSWTDRTVTIYESLALRASGEGAEVIVFPETAIPGALNLDAAMRQRMGDLARVSDAVLVVGAIALETTPGSSSREFFDSAFIVQPDGTFSDRYDKSHLVPFGEYVPLRDWIGWLFKAVARGIADERVSPGERPRSVAIRARGGELTAGVPICYELLFPDLTRRFVDDGGQLMFAITNDAWYGRTGAPHQFLAMTAMRSAETGVWTARAANTGVSAIIDARGRVRQATRIYEPGLLVADVPLREASDGGTVYTRIGDAFAIACVVTAALTAFALQVRTRKL